MGSSSAVAAERTQFGLMVFFTVLSGIIPVSRWLVMRKQLQVTTDKISSGLFYFSSVLTTGICITLSVGAYGGVLDAQRLKEPELTMALLGTDVTRVSLEECSVLVRDWADFWLRCSFSVELSIWSPYGPLKALSCRFIGDSSLDLRADCGGFCMEQLRFGPAVQLDASSTSFSGVSRFRTIG